MHHTVNPSPTQYFLETICAYGGCPVVPLTEKREGSEHPYRVVDRSDANFGGQEDWFGAGPVAFCTTLSCTPNGYRNPRRSIYAQSGTLDQEVLRRRYAGVRLGGLLPGILLAFPIHNIPLGVAWLVEPPARIRFLPRALKDCHAPERF